MSLSKPDLFYDPPGSGGTSERTAAHATPRAPSNPAKLVDGTLERLASRHGWVGDDGFALRLAIVANLMSTPGWEDGGGKKTTPGAKPIGLAQWGAAIQALDILMGAIPGLPYPDPGADPDGFVLLNWVVGDNQFLLELHANLLAQTYKWRRVLSGMAQDSSNNALTEVIAALKAFYTEAKRTAA